MDYLDILQHNVVSEKKDKINKDSINLVHKTKLSHNHLSNFNNIFIKNPKFIPVNNVTKKATEQEILSVQATSQ